MNVSDPTSQNKNKIGLKSPLVQIMQSNKKKISENLKVHRDKYLLKKLKRREKEAKSNSERKRVKKEQNYKIVTKKVNDSGGKSVKNVTFPKRGVSKCLDVKNPPNDKIVEREESAEENSQKGLLLFILGPTSLGENSHFPQNSQEKFTQLDHNDSNNDRAILLKKKWPFLAHF